MSKTNKINFFSICLPKFFPMNHWGKEKLFWLDKSLIVNDITLVGSSFRKSKVPYRDAIHNTIAIITIFVFKTNFLEVYICGLTINWILWVCRDLWNFENKQKHFPKLETKFKSCSYKISALDNNVFNIVAKSNLRVERFKVSNSCNKTSINSSFEFLQILQNHREQLRTPVFFNFSKIVSTIWVSTFFPRR